MAVRDFAKVHGRNWRATLRALWDSGKDEGPLRAARNAIGPSRLSNVFPEKIEVNEGARAERRQRLARGEACPKGCPIDPEKDSKTPEGRDVCGTCGGIS